MVVRKFYQEALVLCKGLASKKESDVNEELPNTLFNLAYLNFKTENKIPENKNKIIQNNGEKDK